LNTEIIRRAGMLLFKLLPDIFLFYRHFPSIGGNSLVWDGLQKYICYLNNTVL
jgi:hypothetical protein